METIQFKPCFVKNRNVRNFEVMMDGLEMGVGEGRLGLVWGQAGRGKTRTSQWWAAHNNGTYLRVVSIWRTSEFEFLKALCRELRLREVPKTKGGSFRAAIDALVNDPRPVFMDEPEKLSRPFFDLIRDLSDVSTAPFILIGEEELPAVMKRNRRVWSRVYQELQFNPLDLADVMMFAADATGLRLSKGPAGVLLKASGGDFRIVRRDMIALAQICNAKGTSEVTEEMARIATRAGLQG